MRVRTWERGQGHELVVYLETLESDPDVSVRGLLSNGIADVAEPLCSGKFENGRNKFVVSEQSLRDLGWTLEVISAGKES